MLGLFILGFGASAHATSPDLVWYLWRTGQDQAAFDAAETLEPGLGGAGPVDFAALDAQIAMRVAKGSAATEEANLREIWGENTADPARRIALAMVITYRYSGEGPYCNEVTDLLAKARDEEMRPHAARIDRERELRCTGLSGHADAELRRLVSEPGPGRADGILAELDAKYIKPHLPPALKDVLAAAPAQVERVGVLWAKGASGPSIGSARAVAKKALSRAVSGDDKVAVHAAVVAQTNRGRDGAAAKATERLLALDPGAVVTGRTARDVRDPSTYGEIMSCVNVYGSVAGALGCLDKLDLGEVGAVAAFAYYQRRLLHAAADEESTAYAMARAAYKADPRHRFNARSFAALAADHGSDDAPLALEALAVVLPDPLPTEVTERRAATLAREVEVRGRLRLLTGDAVGAVADLQAARTLEDSTRRRLLLGMALAEAGRTDEAALQLAYGLREDNTDTKLISAARDALAPLSWTGRGAQGMIDAAGLQPKDDDTGKRHPLVGTVLPADLLPKAPPEGETAARASVITTWASWSPESVGMLERLVSVDELYREKGVRFVALGLDDAAQPELAEGFEGRHAGAVAMRQLQSVAVPTVVVVDAAGKVIAAFSPYSSGGLGLENALDDLVK